jgi:Na+/H+ antiporter NhaD/arsenite permease-like protein
MDTAIVIVFSLAYVAIALEHSLGINKSASALLGAGVLWTLYALSADHAGYLAEDLSESLINTAQIVFFLMGAMAIVEVIDTHGGFEVITSRIKAKYLSSLLWIVALVSFFLSAVLDNLTTTIVMVSLLRKLLPDRDQRLMFAAMVVIAANAGGAWSPIGDVTTTMLWIGGQISGMAIMPAIILPSIVNLLLPLALMSYSMRGAVVSCTADGSAAAPSGLTTESERRLIFWLGLSVLIAVPAFKSITHLPPFMGVLLGLGVLWLIGDLLHGDKPIEQRQQLDLSAALGKIDLSSIMFFTGILLAVAVLEHAHILRVLAEWLDHQVGREELIILLIGLASALVDNVPLVAAAMGMYDIRQYPIDSMLWHLLAYCAGTGGSILIIGSAAGVAAMGMERIGFGWYLRKISWLALVGYLGGAVAYLLQRTL